MEHLLLSIEVVGSNSGCEEKLLGCFCFLEIADEVVCSVDELIFL